MQVVSVIGGPTVLLTALNGIHACAKGASTVELAVSSSLLTIKFANIPKSVFYTSSLAVDYSHPDFTCQVFLKDFVNVLFCCAGFQQLDLSIDPDDSSLVRLCCSDHEANFNCEIRTVDLLLSHEVAPSVVLGSLTVDSEVLGTAFSQCNDSGVEKVSISFSGSLELKTSITGGCDTQVMIPHALFENVSGNDISMTLPGKEMGLITSFLSCLGKCVMDFTSFGVSFRRRLATGNEAVLVISACEN